MVNLRQRITELVRQRKTPREISLGVAIGVFIAVTPLYGFHTLMVFAAAWLVPRANILAMFIGSSVSTTLTLPLITWSGYTIGRMILGAAYPPLSRDLFKDFSYQHLLKLYFPLFIGSLVLAAVLSLVFYYLTLILMTRGRKRPPALVAAMLLSAASLSFSSCGTADARDGAIRYAISPVGSAEYRDEGLVEDGGETRHLAVFTVKSMGFRDREKIYSDPRTRLPLRVEREVNVFLRKEHLIEQYDQEKNVLQIRKFIGGRQVKTYRFDAGGPIHNAVTLPFNIRNETDLKIGWNCKFRIPQEFTVTLAAKETIRVPAGEFTAYRFDSHPRKFQIWLSADKELLPLKISGFNKYVLVLK